MKKLEKFGKDILINSDGQPTTTGGITLSKVLSNIISDDEHTPEVKAALKQLASFYAQDFSSDWIPDVEIVEGDLLKSDAKYICHQCNCITRRAAHLAKSMFIAFPWSDVYAHRQYDGIQSKPGTIEITGDGKAKRYVVALFGQVNPGKPKHYGFQEDNSEAREKYFAESLKELAKVSNLESIDFPYGIGCGAAGGNWDVYYNMICKFAFEVDARVRIIKLD